MNQAKQDKKLNNEDEVSVEQIQAKFHFILKYLLSKWKVILLVAIIAGLAGLSLSIFRKITYTAACTFVLEEESKSGLLGQYAGLASMAGVSLDNAGGLFTGDNIIELYKSRSMIEKTLLSTGEFNGKKQLLIERYIDFNDLRRKWKDKDGINQIQFNGDPASFNRSQDSIITDIALTFNKKYLNVAKPDKKLNIIAVEVKSTDELFARMFANKLVDNVNTFYVDTKTKKSAQNVKVLQHQTDSVRAQLNSSISGVASAMDAAPNANPLLLTLRVPSQKKQIDVQASTAVYGELVKNLELSKMSLRKETPLIQLIDTPVLPLENNRISKIKGLIFGFILGAFLSGFWMTIKGIFSK
jgi:uncharacterized protein involved in exopolysaccharide biosynthesis